MFYNKAVSAHTFCKIAEILDMDRRTPPISKISEFSSPRLKVERSEDVADGECFSCQVGMSRYEVYELLLAADKLLHHAGEFEREDEFGRCTGAH